MPFFGGVWVEYDGGGEFFGTSFDELLVLCSAACLALLAAEYGDSSPARLLSPLGQ